MKKLFGCILSLVMAVMLVFSPAEHVYAQGLGLSVSSSSVAVGKTVKVTVSMPSGYFGTVVISSSDEGVLSNGGDGVANIGDAAGPEYPTSRSFSFTAKAAGSCTIKAYCTVVGDAEANDAGGIITGASTKVTVTSASSNNDSNSNKDNKDNSGSNTGNDSNANKDNENKEEKKSSNASLGSLVISAGTLSPEFSAATKDYTATVDYSCSSLAVTANPADSKASVTSVTGNDSLEVGVTAEDGSTSTYNIVVTRRAEDDPENADKQDNWKKFDINGTEWTMVNDIPEDVVPEGFEHSKTVIDGLEYNTLHGTFGDITLVYLQSESGNGLFVYDAAQNTAYEFVRINSESHFIVVLLPKVDDVPEGYNEISLSIEGKGVATAYQTKVEKTDDQTKDFYLVYAMNDNGESGWYTYDSVDGTYMRTELSTPTVAQEENDTTKSELVPGIANKYLVLAAILVLIIIILALLLLVVIVKNKKRTANEVNDEEDDTKEFDIEENDIEANDDAQESAEESQVDEVQEPAEESGEESQIAEILESDENTESTEASDASYVGRTVEITSDLKKTAENEKSDFDSKEASDQENAADDDTLKNQVQMALDGFVNEENKPSETIDSSAKDYNEDDSEDDDLQFIDLN